MVLIDIFWVKIVNFFFGKSGIVLFTKTDSSKIQKTKFKIDEQKLFKQTIPAFK